MIAHACFARVCFRSDRLCTTQKVDCFFDGQDSFPNQATYRFAHNYYIKFNAEKALFALDQLDQLATSAQPDCTRCHIYSDLLLDGCGMVRKFFVTGNKNVRDEHEEQVTENRYVYEYDEGKYPAISSCEFRNFIEHIEERTDRLIAGDSFFGTFNVIYPGMDDELRRDLTDIDRLQNNTLDLESMTYRIVDRPGEPACELDLNELRQELCLILKRADIVWSEFERKSV